MLAFNFTPLAVAHMERRGLDADEMLGDIPVWLSADNPGSAVDQLDAEYRPIGGGWRDVKGFQLDVDAGTLTYPGDPARRLIASATLRAETILFFDGAWVAVVQPDQTFRVARID